MEPLCLTAPDTDLGVPGGAIVRARVESVLVAFPCSLFKTFSFDDDGEEDDQCGEGQLSCIGSSPSL